MNLSAIKRKIDIIKNQINKEEKILPLYISFTDFAYDMNGNICFSETGNLLYMTEFKLEINPKKETTKKIYSSEFVRELHETETGQKEYEKIKAEFMRQMDIFTMCQNEGKPYYAKLFGDSLGEVDGKKSKPCNVEVIFAAGQTFPALTAAR